MHEANGKAGLARNWLRAVLALDGIMLFLMPCTAAATHGSGEVLLLLFMIGITGLALWYATKQGYWFVRRIERTWKHVCAALGGNFVGEKNDYMASIREGLHGGYVPTQQKAAYPELKNVIGNWQEWSAEIRFIDGQTIEDYQHAAPAFALAYQLPHVQFDLAESGLIRIRAGELAIPQAFDFGQLELTDD